jgi:tetratricopeptide (TPR) repeat protein
MEDLLKALADSRTEAPELWAELKPYRFQDQYHLIRAHRRFVTWGLCELLCAESSRLTTIDPDLAVESAELAVLISDLLKEDGPGRSCWLYQLRGYAWAHDGNARRVLGDLRNADESFSIADAWWEAGQAGAGDCLGYQPVLLDLKASLRIAQRRFQEALSLLDHLFQLHTEDGRPEYRDSHLAGRALIQKALALVQMEEPELSIELLRQAEPLVNAERDPRLFLCLRHNLLWNLTTIQDYKSAQAMLQEVVDLCREQGNHPLSLMRVRWAQGRIAAGLGRTEEAIAIFQDLRREFAQRGIAYDTALVSIELTALYSREGYTAEVKQLSLEMAKIFRAQDVPREAIAALLFFQKAAEREHATAKLAREVSAFLEKLRTNPGLQFDLRR